MQNNSKKIAKRRQTIFLFCLLVVPVAQWLVFWLGVNLNSILLAFQDPRTDAFSMVNFKDFWANLTSPYGDIKIAVVNTLKYFSASLFTILLCFFTAYFFYKKIKGYKIFRVVFYFPAIISSVALVTAYKSFVNPGGPVPMIGEKLGFDLPVEGLLANKNTATNTIVVYAIWTGLTTNVLLFGSAMNRVPTEVVEAALLDGCGMARELFQLILPMIWSSISSVVILALTNIVNSSGPILLFTNGQHDTTTISFWIFKLVYGGGNVGGVSGSLNLASCVGLCFTVVSVPIIMGVKKLFEKIPTVEY